MSILSNTNLKYTTFEESKEIGKNIKSDYYWVKGFYNLIIFVTREQKVIFEANAKKTKKVLEIYSAFKK